MNPGDVLGDRFEIEQAIRAGGMGEVFRARDRVTDQEVAVKVLCDARGNRRERFAREIELLSELSHPGIVRHVGHGATPDGQLFLVMEWLDGCDLKARLEHGSLSLGEVVALAGRVADALGAAHARGIVHRDLKPSNLFLPGDRADQVKILDFGIAHQRGRAQLTGTGTLIGTPGYMAPEQARARGETDARTDVFALGCVVFQCLTGAPPFEGDTPIAVLGKVLFSDAPRVSALRPEVPGELDALVARMLAGDPALRPPDGAGLAAAIAALSTLPSIAHASVVAPRARVARPRAITGSERHLVAVVLLGPGTAGDHPGEGDGTGPTPDEALRQILQASAGRDEQLADGSLLVVLDPERQIATDRAAQAARCALAIHALAPDRPIAIAMGHVESNPQLASVVSDGDVIDHACRLLAGFAGVAGEPPIALDEVTAGLLDARFDVAEHAAGLVLRGEHAVLHGARTLLGRPTSCVGRDWEIGSLTALLDGCIDEPEARAVIVTAAAGIGKSRLAAELVARVRQRPDPVAIWIGRADSLRAGSTLDLLAQALRGALDLHGGEPLAERRAQLRARVARHVAPARQARVAQFLGELVGTPFPDDADDGASLRAARQDAQLMNEQMRRAWLDFLRAEASAHPILLVLEDLHWGDFGTVRFIDLALRELADLPWMVLALARPEVFDAFPHLWADRHHVQTLRLPELGKKAAERLIRQVLGDRIDTPAVERLVHQAGGNAFYLEELIRSAADRKPPYLDAPLPVTVLAMVETRLARLPAEARRVLRAASVFGDVCWADAVFVLVGAAMGPGAATAWLDRLVEQELLVARSTSRLAGQRELAFRHALLREGAYATLTADDQRLGHRLAADWLERHGEQDPIVLAGHFERGGDPARAAAYYLRASEQAFAVLDIDATVARADLGLCCAPPRELRIALLGMRCNAATSAFHLLGVTMRDAEELFRTAPRGSVAWSQGTNAFLYGNLMTGQIPDLLAAIAELHGVEPLPGAVSRVVMTLLNGVCILDTLGQIVAGTALEQRFSEVVHASTPREPWTQFWWDVAIGMRAAYAHEDPWDGLLHSDAIRAIFELTGGELMFLNMQLFRGLNLWFLGAHALAEQTLAEIAAADEALGAVSYLRRFALAWLAADTGALDDARALATQLCDHGRAQHNALEQARGAWVLAEVLRRSGDLDAADRAITAALAHSVPLEHPSMLGTLAALRIAQGRPEDALAAAEDATARVAANGGCGMFRGACLRLVHAEALHATGAHDAARRAIAEARDRLLAVADRITDPAYRRSYLEDVPENARTLALARTW
ncbi:MAG TPA: protein kinase [Kofleriaceae bacterium]|nr:protein kinase [Kofleriaceae bacterium]